MHLVLAMMPPTGLVDPDAAGDTQGAQREVRWEQAEAGTGRQTQEQEEDSDDRPEQRDPLVNTI